jgi:hypothetical protein
MSLTDFIDRSRSNPGAATRADWGESEYRIQNTEFRIQNSEYRIQNSNPPNPEPAAMLGGQLGDLSRHVPYRTSIPHFREAYRIDIKTEFKKVSEYCLQHSIKV